MTQISVVELPEPQAANASRRPSGEKAGVISGVANDEVRLTRSLPSPSITQTSCQFCIIRVKVIPERPPAGPVVKVRSVLQTTRGGSSSSSWTQNWW
jgi:hypothetical protein